MIEQAHAWCWKFAVVAQQFILFISKILSSLLEICSVCMNFRPWFMIHDQFHWHLQWLHKFNVYFSVLLLFISSFWIFKYFFFWFLVCLFHMNAFERFLYFVVFCLDEYLGCFRCCALYLGRLLVIFVLIHLVRFLSAEPLVSFLGATSIESFPRNFRSSLRW